MRQGGVGRGRKGSNVAWHLHQCHVPKCIPVVCSSQDQAARLPVVASRFDPQLRTPRSMGISACFKSDLFAKSSHCHVLGGASVCIPPLPDFAANRLESTSRGTPTIGPRTPPESLIYSITRGADFIAGICRARAKPVRDCDVALIVGTPSWVAPSSPRILSQTQPDAESATSRVLRHLRRGLTGADSPIRGAVDPRLVGQGTVHCQVPVHQSQVAGHRQAPAARVEF